MEIKRFTPGSTRGEENMVRVRRIPISFFDELRNVFADDGDSLALGVSTDGADLAKKFFCPRYDILWKSIRCQIHEGRPLRKGSNLDVNPSIMGHFDALKNYAPV